MVKGKWPALAFLAVDTVAKLNLLAGTLESKISEKVYIERLCPDKPVTSLQCSGVVADRGQALQHCSVGEVA